MKKMILLALLLFNSSLVFAHGYVMFPPSRSLLCSNRPEFPAGVTRNTDCGAAAVDPMSVEGPEGFPNNLARVPDGQIASAGPIRPTPNNLPGDPHGNHGLNFQPLNQQTATRWTKTNIQSGPNQFVWFLTFGHPSRHWQFYITNQNWNPNAPLTRATFEASPFCTINDPGQARVRGRQDPMNCNVPQRTGYQVILAIWTVGDTPFAFYQVIDVIVNGNNPGPGPGPDVPGPNPDPGPGPGPDVPNTNINVINTMQLLQQLRDPNRITQLLQTNQEIQITWVPGMWEDPQPVTFPDAANVVTGRLITLTNRISWAVQVRINGENLAIPANGTVRYTAQGSKWYLVPAR